MNSFIYHACICSWICISYQSCYLSIVWLVDEAIDGKVDVTFAVDGVNVTFDEYICAGNKIKMINKKLTVSILLLYNCD